MGAGNVEELPPKAFGIGLGREGGMGGSRLTKEFVGGLIGAGALRMPPGLAGRFLQRGSCIGCFVLSCSSSKKNFTRMDCRTLVYPRNSFRNLRQVFRNYWYWTSSMTFRWPGPKRRIPKKRSFSHSDGNFR